MVRRPPGCTRTDTLCPYTTLCRPWADGIAASCGVRPVGIQPLRRTVLQVRLGVPVPAALPLILHVGGDFYFKGESEGRVWLSPHDETPSAPCDAIPEEIDVAVAIERLPSVVDWPVAAIEKKWEGMRKTGRATGRETVCH